MASRCDFKLILLGEMGVGKTSLLVRLSKSSFIEKLPGTIAGVFSTKEMNSNGKVFRVGIWDTCGQERFRALVRMYFRDASAAIVCYDITSIESWYSLKKYVEELRDINPDCVPYICGTKKDVVDMDPSKRMVDLSTVSFYTKGIQSKWFETSSKTGENVAEIFQCIADDFGKLFAPNNNARGTVEIKQDTKESKCKC